jgi:hypothetical protein
MILVRLIILRARRLAMLGLVPLVVSLALLVKQIPIVLEEDSIAKVIDKLYESGV